MLTEEVKALILINMLHLHFFKTKWERSQK